MDANRVDDRSPGSIRTHAGKTSSTRGQKQNTLPPEPPCPASSRAGPLQTAPTDCPKSGIQELCWPTYSWSQRTRSPVEGDRESFRRALECRLKPPQRRQTSNKL